MGNICNGNHEKQEQNQTVDTLNKNFTVAQFHNKDSSTIQLILGTYRCHKGDTILIVVQDQYLEYSSELRDYAQNFASVLDSVNSQRKKLVSVNVNRACPYKKIKLCVLNQYKSDEAESYIQQFKNIVKQILSSSIDITFQINHTAQKTNGLPNQTLLGVFFQYIKEHIKKPLKITIISSETKLLNMVRYQIVKLEEYTVETPNDKLYRG